ncbi:GNAT family N-acetyltransferase [Neobacillus notoginsengisoli]|uniref:GNAT family N-acetyltransferase n=1 Tax=Neobacillus notoginsengisoli TaxID=1578198 RepID=A0A417YGV7_9BACI|nr:GNAT family N-acetyltransferase [Neobacillus notoginsengisoli]RHW32115.1 GNAT family N-acetyltransferase [Neobacillus notoginsengisoli]
MIKPNDEQSIAFYELDWDTQFFGISSAKAVLKNTIVFHDWVNLKDRFNKYEFVSIENKNSEPNNAYYIGKDTSAFLVDVNIQFEKKIQGPFELPSNITIHQSLKKNEQILKMADFQYSKFTADPQLSERGGEKVYYHWLLNSFEKSDKYFAIYRGENDKLNGFVLYSFSNNLCVIELIAVSTETAKSGIGTELFKAVEYSTAENGIQLIKVGTQLRNLAALNFYQKVGCKQVGCHQVYHLWNNA